MFKLVFQSTEKLLLEKEIIISSVRTIHPSSMVLSVSWHFLKIHNTIQYNDIYIYSMRTASGGGFGLVKVGTVAIDIVHS
jgi:hypothetical protein